MNTRLSVRIALLLAGMLCVATLSSAHEPEPPAKSHRSRAKSATLDARKRIKDEPFAFRGIPLGITLDSFRVNQPVRATPLGSVPVCETDVMAGAVGMGLKTDSSLTVACRWAHRTDEGWQLSRAVVDGAPAQDHVLRFARAAGDTSFRLYEISFVVDELTANDLRAALADRYGAPRMPARAASAEAASAGAAMPVYVWENAVSSITLCFLPGTRNGTLTYLLKDPAAWVKSVARQWQASSPDAG